MMGRLSQSETSVLDLLMQTIAIETQIRMQLAKLTELRLPDSLYNTLIIMKDMVSKFKHSLEEHSITETSPAAGAALSRFHISVGSSFSAARPLGCADVSQFSQGDFVKTYAIKGVPFQVRISHSGGGECGDDGSAISKPLESDDTSVPAKYDARPTTNSTCGNNNDDLHQEVSIKHESLDIDEEEDASGGGCDPLAMVYVSDPTGLVKLEAADDDDDNGDGDYHPGDEVFDPKDDHTQKLDDCRMVVPSTMKSERSVLKADREWRGLTKFLGDQLDNRMPTEEELMRYFRYLRLTLHRSSSTLYNNFSLLNSTVKARYGRKLQVYTRLTALLKSYDGDLKKVSKKFTLAHLDQFVGTAPDDPYWSVRKIVALVCFFGGLRFGDLCADIVKLENIVVTKDLPVRVYLDRDNNKMEEGEGERGRTKFEIPHRYAAIVSMYKNKIREHIGKSEGRAFWTGRRRKFMNQPLGKNTYSKVSHVIAETLKLDTPDLYTFKSFKRSTTS